MSNKEPEVASKEETPKSEIRSKQQKFEGPDPFPMLFRASSNDSVIVAAASSFCMLYAGQPEVMTISAVQRLISAFEKGSSNQEPYIYVIYDGDGKKEEAHSNVLATVQQVMDELKLDKLYKKRKDFPDGAWVSVLKRADEEHPNVCYHGRAIERA